MRAAPLLVFLLLSLFSATGCYGFLPAPARRDRVSEATKAEKKRCAVPSIDPRVFDAADVESVGPLYSYVQTSGSNREARLLGAEVRLRPLPGVTSELLAYALACRSAQIVLGHARPAESEPYWLPDGWVTIGVRSDDGAFVVGLEGEDIEEAREILERAKAFAQRP